MARSVTAAAAVACVTWAPGAAAASWNFYCQACHEHVTLPQIVVSRLLDDDPATTARKRRRSAVLPVLATSWAQPGSQSDNDQGVDIGTWVSPTLVVSANPAAMFAAQWPERHRANLAEVPWGGRDKLAVDRDFAIGTLAATPTDGSVDDRRP
jgi:hypothetical protein